jgi:hypothetical protein
VYDGPESIALFSHPLQFLGRDRREYDDIDAVRSTIYRKNLLVIDRSVRHPDARKGD